MLQKLRIFTKKQRNINEMKNKTSNSFYPIDNNFANSSSQPIPTIKVITKTPIKRNFSKDALIFNNNLKNFIRGATTEYNSEIKNKNNIKKFSLKSLLCVNHDLDKGKYIPIYGKNIFQSNSNKRPYSQRNTNQLNININCESEGNFPIDRILSFEEILRIKFNTIKSLSININNIIDKINMMNQMTKQNIFNNNKIRNRSFDILNKSMVSKKSQKFIKDDIPILKNDIIDLRYKIHSLNKDSEIKNMILFKENVQINLINEDINKLRIFIKNAENDISDIKNQIFLLRKNNKIMKKELNLP